MTADDLVRGVVRIWSDRDAQVVGTGVLVAPGLVLTCAHVAARAWGEAPDLPDALGRRVRIDFPATAPHDFLDATVVRWLPRRPAAGGAYDLAGLRFVAAGQSIGDPLPLVDEPDPWGKPVRAFGFPAGRPDGSYAVGVLRDVLANGWVLVKGGADAREFTRPGYSGGPVATEAGVVGLLSEGESDVRVREALMIPVRAILAGWPELQHAITRSPFPGLAPFTAADAADFHGRDRWVAELAGAIATPPHLIVLTGPSGSGKSSLIGAGLLPALAAKREDGRTWRSVVWSPGAAPTATLARDLLRARYGDDPGVAVGAARLAHDLEGGATTLADVLGQDEGANHVLVIDQPEGLLLDRRDDATGPASRAQRLFDALLGTLDDDQLSGRVAVVVVVRSDFLDQLLTQPALAPRMRPDLVRYLGPVESLRDVIEAPLRRTGVARLEPGLADRLLAAVADVPNPLPLLQFTMAELWRRRRAGRLTHEAYDALGGVRQALANEAERLVGAFTSADLAAARDVLLQLGRPGRGDAVARRSARFAELGEHGRRIVTRLADARLVITDRDAEGIERVEVIHEALFEHWPRLRGWWRDAASFRAWQEGLRFAVRVWDDDGRHPSGLLQGPRLRAAEAHLRDHPDAFSPDELAFVLRSSAHEQEESEARRLRLQGELRIRRRLNRLLAVGMAAALALAFAALWFSTAARRLEAKAAGLLRSVTELNLALGALQEELGAALGTSRTVLARQLGIQAVAMAHDPATFGGSMRLAALLAASAATIDPGPGSYDHLLRTLLAQPNYRETLADDATAVALDPTGAKLAIGDARGGVRLIDAASGALLGERSGGHTGPVTALAFTRGGGALVSGGADGRLIAWRSEPFGRDGVFLAAAEANAAHAGPNVAHAGPNAAHAGPNAAHAGPIAAVVVTADDRIWLSADLTGTLRAWDAGTRTPLAALSRHAATARSADASATIAAAIPLLPTAIAGQDRDAALRHRAWSAAIAPHPERSIVAVALEGGVAVLDAATLERVWSPAGGGGDTAGLTFDAAGATLVSLGAQGVLHRWPLDSAAEPARWVSGVTGVRALARGRSDEGVLIGTADGGTIWLDLATGRSQGAAQRGHAEDVTAVAVAGDLVISASSDGRVVAWDRAPRRSFGARVGTAPSEPSSFALDSTGAHAFVGGYDGTLTRIALQDPTASATVVAAHEGSVNDVAVAADRVATVGRDGRLVIHDATTLAPLATPYVHDAPLWSVTADESARAWIVGGVRGLVTRIDWDDTQPPVAIREAARVWAPGAVVARANPDTWAIALEETIELWQAGSVVARAEQMGGAAVHELAFHPSGTQLLASSGSVVTLYAVPTLTVRASWPEAQVGAFTPDGNLLALGDADGSVNLLDTATLTGIGPPLRGHTTPVRGLAFTTDGHHLLTIDAAGALHHWPTHVDAWLAAACAIAWRDLEADEITALLGDEPFTSPCATEGG